MTSFQRRKVFELTAKNKQRCRAVAATGYIQVIVLGWVAGEFSSFILLFYYLILRANAFWDSFELYLLDTGHELLELVRVMAEF